MEWILDALHGIGYVLPFLLAITLIVFIHEWGHYIAARANGVKVDVFSIGFGPELFGWNDKNGMRWKVSMIPLGGYIKMAGDADAASQADHGAIKQASLEEQKEFIHTKKPWQKIVVAAAGPIANFLLTIIIFGFIVTLIGKKEGYPIVGQVIDGGAAQEMGLREGDKISKIVVHQENGEKKEHLVSHFRHIQKVVNASAERSLDVHIERDGQILTLSGKPRSQGDNPNMSVGVLGIMPVVQQYPLFQGVLEAVKISADLFWRTVTAIGNIIVGNENANQLGGLFLMAKGAHDYAAQGLGALFEFIAILSLNLGIINLFPIPMLDGGHIVFYIVEWVRGKPVPEKTQDIAFRIGFYLLISLMIYSHWNDIQRFNIFGSFKKLFT